MLPQEHTAQHAAMKDLVSRISPVLSNPGKRGALRGVRASAVRLVDTLHEDLFPAELRQRLKDATNRSTDLPEILEKLHENVEHYRKAFQNIWQGERRGAPLEKRFGHQKRLLDLVRRRRMEAAQFLHTAFWSELETEDGQMKSWANQNSIRVTDLLHGLNQLRSTGLISRQQADKFMESVLGVSARQPRKRQKAGEWTAGERRIDPNTVKNALIDAWGASELERQHVQQWNYPTVKKILQLDKIQRPES